jgi:exodeoxyribonuclease VII small subunit
MPVSTQPVEEMNYEQAFTELESIIATLENEESALEDAIALFERGQALFARCGELLDGAELRVRQLSEQAGDIDNDEDNVEDEA